MTTFKGEPWFEEAVEDAINLAETDREGFIRRLENSESVVFAAVLYATAQVLRKEWGISKAPPRKARRRRRK